MRTAFLSDIHFPSHDPKAWQLTLKILPVLNLDTIHLGGDIIDFLPVSRFPAHPRKKLDLRTEVEVARKELLRLRKLFPNAKFEFREGNHEWRIAKYLYNRAPELVELDALTVPELLRFSKLEACWIPQDKRHRVGKLNFLHGHEIAAGYTYPARNLYLKVGANVICGHYHRFDRYIHRLFDGETHGVWVNGTLQTLTPEYSIHPQWTQGISVIEFTKSGLFHIDQILYFARGTKLNVVVGGKVYEV